MKKIIAVITAAVIVLSMGVICAAAAESTRVYVTIADKDGNLAVAAENIEVTDIDGDNALTVNDALYAAHEQFYVGGAAAGYGTAETQYGLSLDKLWGSANGGSYGYYVNNVSAWSLTDPVNEGDYIAAYVFTDLVGWSDMYTYFDSFLQDVTAGELELTLSGAGYDADWNPVTVPVKGAVITVDGEATDAVTDDEGKAAVTLETNGRHLISATGAGAVIVPPVMIVNVTGGVDPAEDTDETPTEAVTEAPTKAAAKAATPDSPSNSAAIRTGNNAAMIYVIVVLLLFAAAAVVLFRKKNEK